jgi:hypothetical protein
MVIFMGFCTGDFSVCAAVRAARATTPWKIVPHSHNRTQDFFKLVLLMVCMTEL